MYGLRMANVWQAYGKVSGVERGLSAPAGLNGPLPRGYLKKEEGSYHHLQQHDHRRAQPD